MTSPTPIAWSLHADGRRHITATLSTANHPDGRITTIVGTLCGHLFGGVSPLNEPAAPACEDCLRGAHRLTAEAFPE